MFERFLPFRSIHLMICSIVFAACALSGCAVRPASPGPARADNGRAPANDAAQRSVLRQPIPNAEAFLGWKPKAFGATAKVDPFTLPEKFLDCEKSDELTPTHPQMSLKDYFDPRVGTYDFSKLKADDEACKIPGKYKNTKGVYPCIASDTLNYVMISDTYRDACGNLYRGYSEAFYFQRYDNMGTLFSKGRMVEPRPGSSIDGDMIPGTTYPVPSHELVLLTELNPGDEAKIQRERDDALKSGYEYDATSRLWKRR